MTSKVCRVNNALQFLLERSLFGVSPFESLLSLALNLDMLCLMVDFCTLQSKICKKCLAALGWAIFNILALSCSVYSTIRCTWR